MDHGLNCDTMRGGSTSWNRNSSLDWDSGALESRSMLTLSRRDYDSTLHGHSATLNYRPGSVFREACNAAVGSRTRTVLNDGYRLGSRAWNTLGNCHDSAVGTAMSTTLRNRSSLRDTMRSASDLDSGSSTVYATLDSSTSWQSAKG